MVRMIEQVERVIEICYSAPKDDLTAWHYEGVIYRKIDDPENKDGRKPLFAPDVTKGIDGRYYLYYALAGEKFISVAVSEVPFGPFRFYGKVTNNLGEAPKQGAAFDPAVYVEDRHIYLYYGFSSFDNHLNSRFGIEENYGAYVVELDKDMKCIISEPKCVAYGGEYAKSTSFENHTFVLYNMNYKLNTMGLNRHMISIVQFLSNGKPASRQEIQDALDLQKSYTSELLSSLKKSGIIGSEGRGPATRYYLIATDAS